MENNENQECKGDRQMSDREIAESHWKYTKKFIDKMVELVELAYVEAMIHGIKHGKKEAEK